MKGAIDAIRTKKMGWKKASKQFNVPKTTLMRLSNVKYGTSDEAVKVKSGRSTILGNKLENELNKLENELNSKFFPEVRHLKMIKTLSAFSVLKNFHTTLKGSFGLCV